MADRDAGMEEGDVDAAELALARGECVVDLARLARVGLHEQSVERPCHIVSEVVREVDDAFATCERELGGVDIAFLNAGIAIGHTELETLTDDVYSRIMRVNVDGVVYGARAAIRAMERRGGGAIVATSSLAGLIPFPPGPVYDLTKHAVVGLIRSIAPTLAAKGITANTVNPGITDTNILGTDAKELLKGAGFPIMPASQIAEAVFRIVTTGRTGECWVCQPGREALPYEFRQVPGPRSEGDVGKVPPGVREGSFPS